MHAGLQSRDLACSVRPSSDGRHRLFKQVYELVARIPEGKVMTTVGASVLGGCRSARYVGYAMASVPCGHGLPCHRVVNRAGEMAPGSTFGGAGNQRRLLEREGVGFLDNGRIDLVNCLWRGDQT